MNPRTLANAGVHWANTWTTFDVAYAAYLRHFKDGINGIGFVLTPEDPYVAVILTAAYRRTRLKTEQYRLLRS